MKERPLTELMLNRVALAALLVVLGLTLFGVLGVTELIATFMLFVISHQMILDRWMNEQKFSYEEVVLKHAEGIWSFKIGNSICYVSEEGARELHEYLNQTLYSNPTSDMEDDYVF
jgi:hypothetical protein